MTLKKPADADHPIRDLIRNRWSPRSFADKPVAKETLLSLLKAARWSASSNNGQPWAFIVATKEDAAPLFLFDSVDMDALKNYVHDYRPVNRLINRHEVSVDKS